MKKLLLVSSTILATLATKQLLKKGWEWTYDEPAPENPADTETSWSKAIGWTLVTASVAGLANLLVRKKVTDKIGQ